MKCVLRRTALAFALLATTAVGSRAQLYNGGLPNHQNGNEMTEWVQANDFSLAGPATVTGIRFWAFSQGAGWTGSMWWGIFADNAGNPGATLFSGTQTGARVATGFMIGGVIPEYQHDLAVNVALGAGTYWLGLHNGPIGHDTNDNYYWETTNPNGTLTGREDDTPFGDNGWVNNSLDHAFQLYGDRGAVVPEPMTLSLVGTGLVGLAVLRRRRKQ